MDNVITAYDLWVDNRLDDLLNGKVVRVKTTGFLQSLNPSGTYETIKCVSYESGSDWMTIEVNHRTVYSFGSDRHVIYNAEIPITKAGYEYVIAYNEAWSENIARDLGKSIGTLFAEYVVVDNLSFPGDIRYTFVRHTDSEPEGGWQQWNQREVYRGSKNECQRYMEDLLEEAQGYL